MQTTRQKLEKCKKSLEAFVARGGGRQSLRGTQLELRYDGLRIAAMEGEDWRSYCAAHGLETSHSGHDLFA